MKILKDFYKIENKSSILLRLLLLFLPGDMFFLPPDFAAKKIFQLGKICLVTQKIKSARCLHVTVSELFYYGLVTLVQSRFLLRRST